MVAAGTATYFLWDGPNLLQQINANGTVKEEYTNAKSPTIGIGQLVETNRPGASPQKIYPVMDPRGTITKYLQSDGATVLASREYDAFGTIIPNSGSGTWPGIFGYQGESWIEIQSSNGSQRLLLSPTRLYDPIDGRFVSRDPIRIADPKGRPGTLLPWYSFVLQNPVRFIDASGKAPGKINVPIDSGLAGWQALFPTDGLGEDIVLANIPWNMENTITVASGPRMTNIFVLQPYFNAALAAGLAAGMPGGGIAFGALGGMPGAGFIWSVALGGMLGIGILGTACNYYAADCCCCPEDIDVKFKNRINTKEKAGRLFDIPVKLSYNSTGKKDCNLIWSEWFNIRMEWGDSGIFSTPNEWEVTYSDAIKYNKYPGSPSTRPWEHRKHAECPATEDVPLIDGPSIYKKDAPSVSRFLQIRITVNKGSDCTCKHNSLVLWLMDTLTVDKGEPDWSKSSFGIWESPRGSEHRLLD